jgi:hypothetical protein
MQNIEYELAYRQGEILIFKVKKYPYRYERKRVVPSGVIREGEKEGHEHRLEGGQATLELFDGDEEGTIKVDKATTLTHPEHAPIKLPKGDYVMKVQKEATGKKKFQSVKD